VAGTVCASHNAVRYDARAASSGRVPLDVYARIAHSVSSRRNAHSGLDPPRDRHDDHRPFAYALLTGMVVSYARPFMRSNAYGAREKKWQTFPGDPKLNAKHDDLRQIRDKLLAHNDLPPHRATIIWTRDAFFEDRSAIVEARSPISAPCIEEVLSLFKHQENRFEEHLQRLLDQLQETLGLPGAPSRRSAVSASSTFRTRRSHTPATSPNSTRSPSSRSSPGAAPD
jgi:hypothetical protein